MEKVNEQALIKNLCDVIDWKVAQITDKLILLNAKVSEFNDGVKVEDRRYKAIVQRLGQVGNLQSGISNEEEAKMSIKQSEFSRKALQLNDELAEFNEATGKMTKELSEAKTVLIKVKDVSTEAVSKLSDKIDREIGDIDVVRTELSAILQDLVRRLKIDEKELAKAPATT